MTFRVIPPVSERPIRSSELEDWANKEVTPLLKQLRDPEKVVQQGNHILTNLDSFGGGTVRYNVRLTANTGAAGATETCALYIRTNHGATWDVEDRFNGAIYMEVDQYQFLAGNGATKTIHRGWGDAHFVAIMATGDEVPIVDVSNTTPMVVRTRRAHGFGHNNTFQITGVLGNTAANKEAWYGGRVTSPTTLELYNDDGSASTGSGLYISGGQITCINSPVGYEAAHFAERFGGISDNSIGRADGAVGFLSSVQAGFSPTPGGALWESGMGRNKLFEALVENDQLFTGGCYIASDTPNRAFIAIKRQYFTDSGYGGYAMLALEEAYYNPQNNDGSATAAMSRWQLFNDATMRFDSLLSSAGTLVRDAPAILQEGSYWDGAASLAYGLRHDIIVTGAGTAEYRMRFGRPGLESTKFIFSSAGLLDTQGGSIVLGGGDISGVDDITCAGSGSILDMQLGSILAVGDMAFRGSLQGTGAASDGTTTFQDGPPLSLDGTYWTGAASASYGFQALFDTTSDVPAGRLLFKFGVTAARTIRYIFGDDGTMDFQAGKAISIGELRSSVTNWNVGLGGVSYGGGNGVIFIAAATVEPVSDPGGGGILYVNAAGDLMYRTVAGNIRTVAAV